MKKLKIVMLLMCLISFNFLLVGCNQNMNEFKITATIVNINEKIEVNVISAEYASGTYLVITGNQTQIFYEKNSITKEDLKIGDTIEIIYNGQVMMSYPPQIVALKILVI